MPSAEQTDTLAVANCTTVFELEVVLTLEVLSSVILELVLQVVLLCNGHWNVGNKLEDEAVVHCNWFTEETVAGAIDSLTGKQPCNKVLCFFEQTLQVNLLGQGVG